MHSPLQDCLSSRRSSQPDATSDATALVLLTATAESHAARANSPALPSVRWRRVRIRTALGERHRDTPLCEALRCQTVRPGTDRFRASVDVLCERTCQRDPIRAAPTTPAHGPPPRSRPAGPAPAPAAVHCANVDATEVSGVQRPSNRPTVQPSNGPVSRSAGQREWIGDQGEVGTRR
ncbi:MAG: hypothetical protein JWR01_1025 [Subtercola sp.]|nr:hypothetical protein [Subtercola sp.]